MWKFLLGAWVVTSLFDDPYECQRRKYNKLVAEHLAQIDERIEKYIRLIKKDSFAERAIAVFLGDNFHIFSSEDIDYILCGIYEELPKAAWRISEMIDEMPGTPQPRGFGVDFV